MNASQPETPAKLRIDPEFQALIAPLQPDEHEQLESNLVAHGCRDPLVVWRGVLVDGHNRYEICTRRKIAYRTVEMALASREHVLLWIEENQLGRRNLTDDQRAPIVDSVVERRAKLARAEQLKRAREQRGKPKPTVVETSATTKTERTRRAVSRAVKISEWKVRQFREIKKKLGAEAPTLAKIRRGEKTIAEAKHDLRVAEREGRIREAHRIAVSMPAFDRCTLHHCALSEAPLDADSVDVIITDPPYGRESLPSFSELRL